MILAIDMGNTNIEIGCLDDEKIYFTERVSTDRTKTELEYAVLLKTILELHGVQGKNMEGAIISSVVPPLTKILRLAVKKVTDCDAFVVGAGVRTGLDIRVDNPAQVGADLIVDAVAAAEEYGYPCIVIDMGTATTIEVLDRRGYYIGGTIIPGTNASLDSLVAKASQLPAIPLEAPKRVIGRNTVDCMQSGIVFGQACMLDGMLDRFIEELGYDCKVVATGGLSGAIIPHCRRDIIIDPMLMLKGLKIIYDKNRETDPARSRETVRSRERHSEG